MSVLNVLHLALFFGISLLTIEVAWWAYVLNRHSWWMHKLQEANEERRMCFVDGWLRVFAASVMACGLSLIAFFWECYIVRLAFEGILPHVTYAPWIIGGLQLSHIHFFALLARCVCIDREEWPAASRLKSKLIDAAP